MMGYCYETGDGAELDLEDARRWYELAAAKGNKLAIARLEVLERQKP
jgi:TPR repeat protein